MVQSSARKIKEEMHNMERNVKKATKQKKLKKSITVLKCNIHYTNQIFLLLRITFQQPLFQSNQI